MAKKTSESKLSYMQMPLPSGRKSYKISKRVWTGLNYRHKIDSGFLSMEKNISSLEAPALVPASKPISYSSKLSAFLDPVGMFSFGDFLVVLDYNGGGIDAYKFRVLHNSYGESTYSMCGSSWLCSDDLDNDTPRCVVQFNVYDTPLDPVTGQYIKKLLVFPDKKSMSLEDNNDFDVDDMEVTVKNFTPASGASNTPPDTASHSYYYFNTKTNNVYRWVDDKSDSSNSGWQISVPPNVPPIKYATVHLSRVFGVDDGRVYASGFNDYANWNLDSEGEYNESNSWCSPAQSNTKADSNFTGITTYQGHVVCFKRNFMHEIYNTKNPFRIQDIFAEGTVDHRTVQDVNGKLIFASDGDVKIYTGSNPRSIGYALNLSACVDAASGTDGRSYYLYYKSYSPDGSYKRSLFVYDTLTETWSERSISSDVRAFAFWDNKMLMLSKNPNSSWGIFSLSEAEYSHNWSFETDLITSETVNIKHIKKMQMLAEFRNNAQLKVYFLYDDEVFDDLDEDEKEERLMFAGKGTGQKTIRIKPRKTANYGIKLHVEGYGYVKLYELELFVENGGGLYV